MAHPWKNSARSFALSTSIAAMVTMAILPSTSPAAVWDGGGGSGNFSVPANWVGNVVPPNGDPLEFSIGGGTLLHDLGSLTAADGITFNGSSFTLNASGANSLIMLGDITNTSGLSQVINIPLTLGFPVSLNSTNGNLSINGLIDTSIWALTVTGNFSTQISGDITGFGSVVLNSTSALDLSGTNSYTGGTDLVSGNVVIDNADALGTGALTFTNGGLIADGTFTQTSTSTTFNAGTALIAAVTGEVLTLDTSALTINAGANLVFGTLAGGDGTVLFGDFSGTFSTASTATVRVAAGTLRAGAFLNVITETVASTTIDAGATLDLNGEGGDIRNLQGAGAIVLGTNASSALSVQSGSFQGSITGTGNAAKNSAGLLTISTAAGRININGTFRINEGEVALNGGNVFSTLSASQSVIIGSNNVGAPAAVLRLLTDSQIFDTQAVTVNASGTLNTNGYFERVGALTIDGGAVDLEGAGGGQAFVIDGLLTMTAGSISGNTGFNEVTLLGNVVATSTATSTAQIDSRVSLNGNRTFTVNDGPATFDLQIIRVVEDGSGASRLIKSGAGGLLLVSTANTYSGGTEINGGILAINDNGGLGTGDVIFSGNSELRVVGGPSTINKTFTVDPNVTARFSNSTGSNATLDGSITVGSGADLAFGAAGATGVIVLQATGGSVNFGHDFNVDFGTVRNGDAAGFNFFTSNFDTTNIAATGTLDAGGFNTTIRNLQGSGTILNSGVAAATVTVSGGNFSGVIKNDAGVTSLVKSSSNTLTLSGANTYTGGTTINAGRMITQNASALGSAAGPVALNAGVLEVHGTLNTGDFTWAGGQVGLNPEANDLLNVAQFDNANVTPKVYEIDTAGIELQTYVLTQFTGQTGFTSNSFTAVAKDGSSTIQGTFLLTANQVQLTITGVAVTGSVIQNSAPVNTPEFADFTVSGQAQTGGATENNTVRSLTFSPNSSLSIFNTLNVTGAPVNLVPGSSIHLAQSPLGNATLNASQLYLLFGSTLTGNGRIAGDLYNNGLVSPGNSPGTIYVSRNYTQGSQGTLKIEIGGDGAGEYDLLAVDGRASLDGTLELVRLNDYRLKRGQRITFLTAGEGVDGEFSRVSNPFTTDSILEPTVVYRENTVSLELVRGSFEDLASRFDLTPNQRATARALDSVSTDEINHEALVYLDERRLDQLPGDFDRIAPEELSSIFTISTALSQVQGTNLQRRTDDIRHGSSGFSASGLAMQGTGPGYSGAFDITTGVAGPTGKESKEVKQEVPEEQKRWGAFLTGVGEWVDVSGDGNARGFDITTGGFTLGLDYKVTDNFAIGINAGYAGTKSDLAEDGAVWVNGGKLGLYATYFPGGFYLDTAVTGGYNSYDTKRSALEGSARGSTEGGELNVLVGAGYDWKIGGLQIGPTATFNYTLTGMDDFTEHGSLAPLHIDSRSAESIRSAFGIKASYDWKCGGVIVRPEVRAAWQHEYGDKSYDISASFAGGAGDTFLVNGPEVGRDSVLLGAGFAIQFSETCSTYFYYDGELGRERYDRHSVSGGVRLAF